jgi:uncharacterized protein YjbJ (UPF0337 family)
MRASTKNLWGGKYHEVKGSVKTAMGNTVNSRRMVINGHIERVGGIFRANVGKFEKVFGW